MATKEQEPASSAPDAALLLAPDDVAYEYTTDSDLAALGGREKDTYRRQSVWLGAYVASHGSLEQVCGAAKVSIRTYQRWKGEDVHGFAARFEVAHLTKIGWLEDKLVSLIEGLKPGMNPLPLLAALNAEAPDKYRPNAVVTDETARETLRALREAAKAPKPTKAEAERTFLDTLP